MCRGTQRPNSLLLLFFFCLFISTFSHYIRNRYRHFLFISLFPRTVTLFQICYYPFFIRIYSSVDSLFLVLFIITEHRIYTEFTQKTEYRTQKNRTQNTENRTQKNRITEHTEPQNYRIPEARTGIILFTIVSPFSTCSLVLTFLSVYPFPTTTCIAV